VYININKEIAGKAEKRKKRRHRAEGFNLKRKSHKERRHRRRAGPLRELRTQRGLIEKGKAIKKEDIALRTQRGLFEKEKHHSVVNFFISSGQPQCPRNNRSFLIDYISTDYQIEFPGKRNIEHRMMI